MTHIIDRISPETHDESSRSKRDGAEFVARVGLLVAPIVLAGCAQDAEPAPDIPIDGLISNARDAGFTNLGAIRDLARAAVELRPASPNIGSSSHRSKLGGLPNLPPSIPWPTRDGSSLAFIAQIDLGEMPELATVQGMPRVGLLLFFYVADQSTWGFDPKDAGSFAVIHVPEAAGVPAVSAWPSDIPEEARYPECFLAPGTTVTIPPWQCVLIEDLKLDGVQEDAYHELLEVTAGDDAWASRMLLGGYPDQIQGDMSLECARVTAKLNTGAPPAYHDDGFPRFRAQAREWRLLLQVPSVDAANMMWGDVGCLYYWIREDDLKARRFDRCWMILQCS